MGLNTEIYSVSKDVREQIKWLCLFSTKDWDSFEDCLRENDVIPDKNERDRLKKCLQDRQYSKLILNVISLSAIICSDLLQFLNFLSLYQISVLWRRCD